jgi:hypothetical protein
LQEKKMSAAAASVLKKEVQDKISVAVPAARLTLVRTQPPELLEKEIICCNLATD